MIVSKRLATTEHPNPDADAIVCQSLRSPSGFRTAPPHL
jgi:hypothetical protein